MRAEQGKQGLVKQITAFQKEGWKVDDLHEIDVTNPYNIISPRGRVFRREQLIYGPCTICYPWDFDAICVHDEKDLEEGDKASEFAELLEKIGFPY